MKRAKTFATPREALITCADVATVVCVRFEDAAGRHAWLLLFRKRRIVTAVAKRKRTSAQVRRGSFELVRKENATDSLAGAAADRCVVERDVAAAAALAAGGEAIAARLENRAAGLVAGDAGDAAAVLGVLTLAGTAGEVALAAADAVRAAADAAKSVAEHAAEVLQGAASHFVFATTMDLEAAGALLELNFAARQDAPIGAGR
jgi:hypothetical protein